MSFITCQICLRKFAKTFSFRYSCNFLNECLSIAWKFNMIVIMSLHCTRIRNYRSFMSQFGSVFHGNYELSLNIFPKVKIITSHAYTFYRRWDWDLFLFLHPGFPPMQVFPHLVCTQMPSAFIILQCPLLQFRLDAYTYCFYHIPMQKPKP